jgi:hypothetical protein
LLPPRRLSKTDQERVFPNSVTFECPEDQEAFVREWAQKRTGLACDFKVKFYPGRYAPEKGEFRRPIAAQQLSSSHSIAATKKSDSSQALFGQQPEKCELDDQLELSSHSAAAKPQPLRAREG